MRLRLFVKIRSEIVSALWLKRQALAVCVKLPFWLLDKASITCDTPY